MHLSRVVLAGVLLACGLSGSGATGQKDKDKIKTPEGWAEYQPAEKDFSVVAPAELDDDSVMKMKEETLRLYTWKKGDALLSVKFYSDRKDEALKDDTRTFKLLALDNRIVKGSMKDVKADGVPGIEYTWKDDGVVSTFRVYRSADGSKAANLAIRNSDKLTAEERTAFLASFKFAKPKK